MGSLLKGPVISEFTTEQVMWNKNESELDIPTTDARGYLTSEPYGNLFNISGKTEVNVSRAESYLSLMIIEKANYVIFPLLLLFGVVGNALTIIIMQSKHFQYMTSKYFLISLAVSDTTLLLLQVFNKNFIIDLFGQDLRAICKICCKTFFVLFRTSKMVSSWFVVFLCMERFVAVWFPLKSRKIITKRVIIVQIISVTLLIGGLNSFWSYASQISDTDGQCHPDTYNRNNIGERFKFMVFLTVASCLYSFIPSAILIIFTPMIISKLAEYRNIRKKMVAGKNHRKDHDFRISVMLIGIMISFVILVTPVILLHIITNYKGLNTFGENGIAFSLYLEIAQILEQTNYSINFCLYNITSSQFRQSFLQLMKICATKKMRNVENNFKYRQEEPNKTDITIIQSIVLEESKISNLGNVTQRRQSLLDVYIR